MMLVVSSYSTSLKLFEHVLKMFLGAHILHSSAFSRVSHYSVALSYTKLSHMSKHKFT